MIKFFHKTNFNFSVESRDWILNRYDNRFNKNFDHNLDTIRYTTSTQDEWKNSIVGKELIEFLSYYNCDTSYFGITAHICNRSFSGMCLPHIDYRLGKPVSSRFNVMILGNTLDPMYWWPNISYDSPVLFDIVKKNTDTGIEYQTKTFPGNSLEEKLKFLGDASMIEAGVASPSAFVKTDCIHSIFLSAGPRLLITVAFNKPIEDIIGTKKYYGDHSVKV